MASNPVREPVRCALEAKTSAKIRSKHIPVKGRDNLGQFRPPSHVWAEMWFTALRAKSVPSQNSYISVRLKDVHATASPTTGDMWRKEDLKRRRVNISLRRTTQRWIWVFYPLKEFYHKGTTSWGRRERQCGYGITMLLLLERTRVLNPPFANCNFFKKISTSLPHFPFTSLPTQICKHNKTCCFKEERCPLKRGLWSPERSKE